MIYGYVRVSTDMQTVENQRFEIETRGYKIDKWVCETVSGAKDYKKRDLYRKVLKCLKPGDTIVCSEISRLARSLFMVIEIMNYVLVIKKAHLITVKENFILDDSLNAKVVSFAFGLAAEVERSLISQRTKEAMARLKAQGVPIGRQKGSKNRNHSLDKHRDYILKKIKEGKSNNYIKERLHCHIRTLKSWLILNNIPAEREGMIPHRPKTYKKSVKA